MCLTLQSQSSISVHSVSMDSTNHRSKIFRESCFYTEQSCRRTIYTGNNYIQYYKWSIMTWSPCKDSMLYVNEKYQTILCEIQSPQMCYPQRSWTQHPMNTAGKRYLHTWPWHQHDSEGVASTDCVGGLNQEMSISNSERTELGVSGVVRSTSVVTNCTWLFKS